MDKNAVKRKIKQKVGASAGYQEYSKDMKVDPRTTKADAIADVHAEARYQKGEPKPLYTVGGQEIGTMQHMWMKTKKKKVVKDPPTV